MHKELPFTFTETSRLTWLNYRWFLTTHCTVSEKTSAVLHWRHSQHTTAAFRSVSCQSLLHTTQSSPGATAFLPLVSFVVNIFLRMDFLLPFSNSLISQCPAEHLMSKHWRSPGSYPSCRLPAIMSALRDTGTVLASTSPSVAALLSLAQNHCFRSHVARLHRFPSEPSGPPKYKSSLLFLFVNYVNPWSDIV